MLVGVVAYMASIALPATGFARVVAPVAAFISASFLTALAGVIPGAALLATALKAAGIAAYLAGLTRDSFAGASMRARAATAGALGLALLVVLHNVTNAALMAGRARALFDTVNPWGLAVLAIAALYWLRSSNIFARGTPPGLVPLLTGSSYALFVLLTLISAGVLPGNTGKAETGMGGVGLANHSTNETATFAVALMALHLRTIGVPGGNRGLLLPAAILANAGTVLFTQSRTGLVSVFLLLLAHVMWGGPRWRRLALASSPLLLVFGFQAYRAIRARTTADIEGQAGTEQLGAAAMPGSGRAIIWFSYVEALAERAEHRPLTWAIGTGPADLASMYEDTPLPMLRLTAEHVDFLPTHSDVVTVFVATGFVGLGCWLLLVAGLARAPRAPPYRAAANGALMVYVFVSMIDMVTFQPVGSALLLLCVGSAVANRPAPPRPSFADRSSAVGP